METLCIPRKRYEYRIKCERLVNMEFGEKFSDEFIIYSRGQRERGSICEG